MKLLSDNIYIFLSIIGILLFSSIVFGQENRDTSSTGEIIIYNSDNTIVKKKNDDFIRYFKGNVKIFHDSTFFFADTAIMFKKEITAWGNIVIIQHDTISIFSDSLYYNGDSLKAELDGKILLKNGENEVRTQHLKYDIHNKIAHYNTGAELKQKSSILKSVNGIYFVNDDKIKFENYVSIKDSSFNLYADSLFFDTKNRIAYFSGPTIIKMDSSNIYCESGYYDIKNGNALFEKNMNYKKNTAVARSKQLFYIDSLSQYILAGDAVYTDEELVATADTIIHNTKLNQSILIGRGKFKNKNQSAEGDKITYNHDDESFISDSRSTLRDDAMTIIADYSDYSKKTGKGFAKGKVIFIDTSSNIRINSSEMYLERKRNYMLSYGDSISRLLMMFIEKNDTTFISSDTLISMDIINEIDSLHSDTIKFLRAFNNVKIYNKDYQAISDSLVYFPGDSVYVLFNRPVLWSDSTQITGDTISIKIHKSGIDNIFSRKNAFITNYIQGELFNQIKGIKIISFFENDSLKTMDVNGNAEVVYHMQDDEGALTGTINTICSKIIFNFKQNKIKDIKFFGDPKSNFVPIQTEISNPQRLKGFQWFDEKRPKTKDEILIINRNDN
jgi:lipopolysaccharide export system protein LptA